MRTKRLTLTYRMRPDLHKKLQEAALDNDRSLNDEITGRLLDSFEHDRMAALIDASVRNALAYRNIPLGRYDLPNTPNPSSGFSSLPAMYGLMRD